MQYRRQHLVITTCIITFLTMGTIESHAVQLDSVVLGSMQQSFKCWQPDYHYTQSELLEIITRAKLALDSAEEAGQQQPMNYAVAVYFRALDSYLYLLVAEQLSSVSEYDRGPIIQQQRAWLRHREAVSDSVYYENFGGTLAPYLSGKEAVRVTLERIADLER